jgi:stalled ribosome rescue protein Dom34
MEVEAMRRMVKRREDGQKVAVVVVEQDSRMVKEIRKSSWNVKHKCHVNYGKRELDSYCRELPKEER